MTVDDKPAPKVAVVVPVYNAGSYLAQCIESVLAQTMPPGELEAVFVDDGSTDGSGATLDALAARHPHIRVIHEAPSGWAGRPRNVGVDAATAEFILFLDHDDRLGTEAAQRLYDRAVADGSDVVLGRSVGHGRPNSSQLSWRTRGPVRFEDDPELVNHLKPHKLLRRAFLVEHQIRFPEGKVRLEDQVFILQAYFLAKGISVVGDYVCYHHRRRSGNAASTPWEPAFYYKYVRANLDVIERNTTPGLFRDRLMRRVANIEMLSRLAGKKFVAATSERRAALLAEIRSILEDYMPPDFDLQLIPPLRAVAGLARADRLDLLVALAKAGERAIPTAVASSVEWVEERGLRLVVDVTLPSAGKAIGIEPNEPDGWRLLVPEDVAAVMPSERLGTQTPIRGVVELMAIDQADVATSLEIQVAFVPASAREASGSGRLRVDAVLPFAALAASRHASSRRLQLLLQLRVTPNRRRVPVTVADGLQMPAFAYRPELPQARQRTSSGWRQHGDVVASSVVQVGPANRSDRVRRPLSAARRHVRRGVKRVMARAR